MNGSRMLLTGMAVCAAVLSLTVAGCQDRRTGTGEVLGTGAVGTEQGVVARAYPTGDRGSSVLLVENRAPARAQAGAPIIWETRVTNLLNDVALRRVVVTYDLRDNFTVGQTDTMRGTGQPAYDRAGQPAQMRGTADPQYDRAGQPNQMRGTADPQYDRAGQPNQMRGTADPQYDRAGQPARVRGTAEPTGQLQQRDGQWVWNVGQLAPGESRTLRFSGAVLREGTSIVCTEVEYEICPGCLAIEAVAPALNLTLSVPQEVLICEPITARLQVSNTGSGTARNVQLSGNLPPGLTNEAGRNTFSMNIGDLPAGQSREQTIRLNAQRSGDYTINATAMGDGGLSAGASGAVAVREPRLQLNLAGPQRHYVNSVAEYTLRVSSTGNGPARDTVVSVNLPAGAQFVSAGQGGRMSANTATWNLGTIPPGQSRDLNLAFRHGQAGEVRVRATATALCVREDQAISNEVVTRIEGIPAILLEMVDEQDPIAIGQNETYTVRVTNQGSEVDRNVRIIALIPNEAQFVSAQGPTRESVDGNRVTFAPLDSLAPRQTATYTITVRARQPGDVRMQVQLQSDMLTAPVLEEEATRFFDPARPDIRGTGEQQPGQQERLQPGRPLDQQPQQRQPQQQPQNQSR